MEQVLASTALSREGRVRRRRAAALVGAVALSSCAALLVGGVAGSGTGLGSVLPLLQEALEILLGRTQWCSPLLGLQQLVG